MNLTITLERLWKNSDTSQKFQDETWHWDKFHVSFPVLNVARTCLMLRVSDPFDAGLPWLYQKCFLIYFRLERNHVAVEFFLGICLTFPPCKFGRWKTNSQEVKSQNKTENLKKKKKERKENQTSLLLCLMFLAWPWNWNMLLALTRKGVWRVKIGVGDRKEPSA